MPSDTEEPRSRSSDGRRTDLPDEDRTASQDLLGLIGCGELFAFETLARDSAMAPGFTVKAMLGEMACREFGNLRRITRRLEEMGADAELAVGLYVPTMTDFHRKTAPRDLLEGLMKVYVGQGISSDFGREIADYLDPETRAFIIDVLGDQVRDDYVVPYIQRALQDDPAAAGRLALWGRRLMGEALALAQRVATERPDLARVIIGDPAVPGSGGGMVAFTEMLARMTKSHSQRMERLGLAP